MTSLQNRFIAAPVENYFLLRLTVTVKAVIAAANGTSDITIPVGGLGVTFPRSTSLLSVLLLVVSSLLSVLLLSPVLLLLSVLSLSPIVSLSLGKVNV